MLANLDVLAGIIFLAIELQQNTEIVRAQTRHAMTENQISWYIQRSDDIENRSVYTLGRTGQDLTPAQMAQFADMMTTHLRILEDEWYQYQNGLFEKEEFEPSLAAWKATMQSQSYRDFWQSQKQFFSPSFGEQLVAIIPKSDSN